MARFVSYERVVQEQPKLMEVILILDSVSDLPSSGAGYAPGSIAFIADRGYKKYMLNASYEWKEL